MYKAKYVKYKAKYLKLQIKQIGGLTKKEEHEEIREHMYKEYNEMYDIFYEKLYEKCGGSEKKELPKPSIMEGEDGESEYHKSAKYCELLLNTILKDFGYALVSKQYPTTKVELVEFIRQYLRNFKNIAPVIYKNYCKK